MDICPYVRIIDYKTLSFISIKIESIKSYPDKGWAKIHLNLLLTLNIIVIALESKGWQPKHFFKLKFLLFWNQLIINIG